MALTYEQKRNLLEMFLTDNIEKNEEYSYIWVADLTEDLCYYCVSGEYYQAAYSITEAEVEGEEPVVTINIAEAKKAVRDWKTFEEDVECSDTTDESSENLEHGSEENFEENSEDEGNEEPEKKEESETEFEEESEKKTNNTDDDTSEDDSDEENDQETECNMDDNQEDEQCKMDTDDDSETTDDSDDVQDDDNCVCVLNFNDVEHKVSQEVFDYFNVIIMENDNLSNNLNTLTSEKDALSLELQGMKENFETVSNENVELKKQIAEAQNLELSKKAYSIAIKEGFTEEESKAFETDCLNGKYSDETTLTKEIIYQSFLRKQEENEVSEQKDFSAKISDNVKEKTSVKEDSSSKLKNYINK